MPYPPRLPTCQTLCASPSRRAWLAASLGALAAGARAATAVAGGAPVLLGLDAEFSLEGSRSAQSIELGIRVAMEEINAAGGLLGGRPLALVTRDSRTNPARGMAHMVEFAAMPDLVAVFGGRFSPVVSEMVKPAHELEVPLLAPWSSATGIIDNGQKPNYAFRLSLFDRIAVPAMLDLAYAAGHRRLGVMVGNTSWGRSNREAAELHAPNLRGLRLDAAVHNVGDTQIVKQYLQLVDHGAQAMLLMAADLEAVQMVKDLQAIEPRRRVPVIAHWGLSGTDFVERAGAAAVAALDFSVIQTFSLLRAERRRVQRLMDIVRRLGGSGRVEDLRAPVGFGHAYDLTHILARAVQLAGTVERPRVRDALEQVRDVDGLLRRYERPFTPERHEALRAGDLFFARFRADGMLVPIALRQARAG